MSEIRTRHTPGPWWAERADEYDRRNGRLHLGRVVLAPPMQAGGEPEPVAYVDTDGDVAMVLAGPFMLGELIGTAVWLEERAKVLRQLADQAPGVMRKRNEHLRSLRDEAARFEGRAAVIRQTILKATQGA